MIVVRMNASAIFNMGSMIMFGVMHLSRGMY